MLADSKGERRQRGGKRTSVSGKRRMREKNGKQMKGKSQRNVPVCT